jgi:glycosyltransferase involved in cell wall biosynthesis
MIRGWIARLTVFLFVGMAMVVHAVGCRFRGGENSHGKRPFRVFLIGAFDSAGWIQAHAGPLAYSQTVDEVLVICDEPFPLELDGVSFCCASPRMRRWLGRGGGRVAVLFREGFRLRPDVYMGYHIMPNAPLAMLAAGLFGGKAIYQMTGGPIQIEKGGVESENPLLRATRTVSEHQENLLASMVRRFDLVIVRGSKARDYLRNRVRMERCAILTGAIDIHRFVPRELEKKDVDIVVVSRLVASFKGMERVLDVLGELAVIRPDFQAVIAGDGPAREVFLKQAEDLGIADRVSFVGRTQDVRLVLNRGKVFVLLSPSEGMSIAMLEAMACGLPVVVTDVGELSDALKDDGGGQLVNYLNPTLVAHLLDELLSDPSKWRAMSAAARKRIADSYSVEAVAKHWDELLSCRERSKLISDAVDDGEVSNGRPRPRAEIAG